MVTKQTNRQIYFTISASGAPNPDSTDASEEGILTLSLVSVYLFHVVEIRAHFVPVTSHLPRMRAQASIYRLSGLTPLGLHIRYGNNCPRL